VLKSALSYQYRTTCVVFVFACLNAKSFPVSGGFC